MKRKVAIQGIKGCNHYIAAKKYFAGDDIETIDCATFNKLAAVVSGSESIVGVMAIENTIAGSILPNYQIIRKYNLEIIGEYKLRIEHALVGIKGINIKDIKEVNSHPMALMQCEEYLSTLNNVKLVEKDDTANSAKWIKDNNLIDHAAICPADVAELFDMDILANGIETDKCNYTRFLIVKKRSDNSLNKIIDDKINKSSLAFTLSHNSGSLSRVLSVLSFYDMNLSMIQSLPIVGREWEYRFYINLLFADYERYLKAIDAIVPLCKEFEILGEYEEDRNNINRSIVSADRLKNVSEYYFSVKLKEIEKMRAVGRDIINLGIGSPDLPPRKSVVDSLCNCASRSNSHGYQSYIGIPELRNGFANLYKEKYNVELNPDCEILPLMGSKEGIMHISMAFLNVGDSVLIPNPGYPTYSSVSKLLGANIIEYKLNEENNWYPDIEKLEQDNASGKINLRRVKLMWCNYPNMPTGASGSVKLFEELVAFGRKHNIVICHDNPYSFILNEKPISILSIPGAKDICIELNSMSKTFNMPGWRVGMVASCKKFIEWVTKVKSNMDSGMFRGLQEAAVEALRQSNEDYIHINDIYLQRQSIARQILEAAGCEVKTGQQGMFLWGRIIANIEGDARDCVSKRLSDNILYDCGVFITPGFIFGSQGNDYMRISLCCKETILLEALEKIKSLKSIKCDIN